jgi:hypothetical protein
MKKRTIYLLTGTGAVVNIVLGFGTVVIGYVFPGPGAGTPLYIELVRKALMLIMFMSWFPLGLFPQIPENGYTMLVIFAINGAFWFLIGGQIVLLWKNKKQSKRQ